MKILSSNGFKHFDGISNQGKSKILYRISFEDGSSIKATHDHRFMKSDGNWVLAQDLEIFTELKNKVVDNIELVENEYVYDPINVDDVHNYYSNGVISHNCNIVYVDEAAIIPNNVAEEFFRSVFPTISSGENTKLILSSTPRGYNHFWKFWSDAECGRNDYVPLFIPYWEIPGRDKNWADTQLKVLGELAFNQEVLCKFLGSSLTLINGSTLSQMSPGPIIHKYEGLDIYESPVVDTMDGQGNIYFIVVDTSEGLDQDFSAFVVIDVTMMPYKVVAKFKDNNISPLVYPSVIHKVAKDYNNAYVLVEINRSDQVADILYNEYEYENMIFVNRGQYGQIITGGFGSGKTQLGVVTDKKVKRLGCLNLKNLVEQRKLLIPDPDIISELSTFIQSKNSFEADVGYNDDLVMCLVLFAWATTNTYFRDLCSVDIRASLYEKQIMMIEHELTPFGFFDDGQSGDDIKNLEILK